jgi:hypothetical protein
MSESLPQPIPPEETGQLALYRTEDGRTRINVRLIQDSVWLTLNRIADLFQRDKSVISKHVKNIFEDARSPLSELLQNLQQFKPRVAGR